MTYRIYHPSESECDRLDWSYVSNAQPFVIVSDKGYYWYDGTSPLNPEQGWPQLYDDLNRRPFTERRPKDFAFSLDCLIAEINPQTHPELFI